MVQGIVSKWLPLTAFCIAALLLASCQRTGRQGPASAAAAPQPSPQPAGITLQPSGPASPPAASAPTSAPAGSPQPQPSAPPQPAGPPPQPAGAQQPPAAPPAPGTPPPGVQHIAAGTPGTPQAAAVQQKGLASAATLMALGRGRRILPEDFKIGPLGDDRSGGPDEGRALSAASTFLSHLVTGSVDKKLLASESQDTVADTLAFGLKQGHTPKSYRIGVPKSRDNGEVTAAVRLFGPEGTSEGEIYVSPSGSQWLVADLQLSLAQLSIKQDKPKEKFFPLEYRWLLEE